MMHKTATALAAIVAVLGAAWAEMERPARLFPAGPEPARILDVVDLHGADDDTKLAATTLQGLANRDDEAAVFLKLFDTRDYPTLFWLDELERKGYIDGTRELGADAYFDAYLDHAQGLVLYDPALPATMNIATMIAAVESRMVVAPRDAARFARPGQAPPVDLRGRWETNAAAYGWAFETLWPKMRHDIATSFHPTHTKHHLRDYLVSQRIFTFWVTGPNEPPLPRADHQAEKAVAGRVLRAMPPTAPILGWWGTTDDDGMTEYGGVGWAGRFGHVTFATNWQTNLSLLTGVPVDFARVERAFRERPVNARAIKPEAGKTYISFVVMESGDSPAYWQHVQKRVWDDPKRGALPIGWSITPALLDLLPPVGAWFLEQAGPNDHFFLALSGWGYCHPYRGFMAEAPDPEAGWRAYVTSTGAQMARLGLRDLGLYTDAWRPFRRAERDAVTRRFAQGIPGLRGLIMGMGRDAEITETCPHYRLGGTLVSHVFTRWDAAHVGRSAANNRWLAQEIRAHAPESKPAFMFVHPLSWSYYPSDLAEVAEMLGEAYVAVSPGELFALIDGSLEKAVK